MIGNVDCRDLYLIVHFTLIAVDATNYAVVFFHYLYDIIDYQSSLHAADT